jgi:hypothetical protein
MGPEPGEVDSHRVGLRDSLWICPREDSFPGLKMSEHLTRGLRKWLARAGWMALAAYVVVFFFNLLRPLPSGVSFAGPFREVGDLEFLYDLTVQRDGELRADQRIFDRVFSIIDAAEEFVVVDMFLFNGEHGGEREYRPLSAELTRHLLARRAARPDLETIFITDEINNFYGAYTSPEIAELRGAGVQVITTRMTPLRDSNPVFSAGWRILAKWFGTGGPGWLPHPLSSTGRKVTARSYLKLLNMKANHRKLVVTEKECLVGSANPHDASGFHSNIAFAGSGGVCEDLLESEKAAAALSGVSVTGWPAYGGRWEGGVVPPSPGGGGQDGSPGFGHVQVVTEGKIFDALMEELRASGAGDRVDLAMFYLSERRVVGALLEAAERGAVVRLVLDPNKDAFGLEKRGIPNRQVARELVDRSDGRIRVRWYDTHGEQFHTKLVVVTRGDQVAVLGGSANLTRRNIRDFNLETDLRLRLPVDAPMALAVREYFDDIFTNRDAEYTVPFERYRDDSWLKGLKYRFQESTGLSSF